MARKKRAMKEPAPAPADGEASAAPKKRAKMTEQHLMKILDAEFADAQGLPSSDLSQERAKAWDYYLSKLYGDEEEGQSKVVTSDVSDVVDGIMPSLLRIFTIAENLASFEPVGEEDEEQAAQESDYVNYVFFKRNPAFMIMFFWFFDALVQKNGYVKAWWDDAPVVTQESYQGLSADELALLMEDEELAPIEWDEREELTVEQELVLAQDGVTLVPRPAVVRGIVFDVKFRRTTKRGRIRVDNIPPENFRISGDSRALDPSDARMSGEQAQKTRRELKAMGFDATLVDELPKAGGAPTKPEAQARRHRADEQRDDAASKDEEKVDIEEAYLRIDYDGDGYCELRQVFRSNGKILGNEIVDRSPYHAISPVPLPHKHVGRSLADKAMDVQEVTSVLTRQTLENIYHSNRPSHGVWEQGIGENTLSDLLTSRVGSIKRFARPPGESYMPITVPFTATASFPMLEHFDRVKRERTGVSANGDGLSPEALKNIQIGVLAEARGEARGKQEAIARIFAETGFKSLFLHIHELTLKHQDKPGKVKLRNTWVPIDPRKWRTREDMTVNIGLGIGTRTENLMHLTTIRALQKEIIDGGGYGTLVTPINVWNLASEVVKNSNLKNPELYFSPSDELPQQNAAEQQMRELEAALAARQQELDATKQELAREKMLRADRREGQRLELKREEQEDDFTVAMEQIQNDVAELGLKYRGGGQPRGRTQ